jgi:hypothetical protein
VVLALLCGLGGGNFASSMANISYFFPSARQGYALGLNAGLGHLGVAGMQLLVPLAISASVFGIFDGPPQSTAQGPMWLQNAGFIWVPLILASTAAAWFGMDDLADRHAGMAEQAVIFTRRHNWLMCWLYLGTFGSFIGFSASLPMLAQSQYQRADAMHLVWLGPLIGAVLRPLGGWMADRWGGARVTFWVFVLMALAALVRSACPADGERLGLGRVGNFTGFLAAFGRPVRGVGHRQRQHLPDDLQPVRGRAPAAADELPSARAQAAKRRRCRGRCGARLCQRHRRLRRLLHPQERGLVAGDHRQRLGGAGDVHRVLPLLHRVDLVGLQPPQRTLPLLVHFLKPARGRALPRTTT